MLHRETISQDTLKLLHDLCSHASIQGFALAGGTALALQIGHRISLDLDFFTQRQFNSQALFEYLKLHYQFFDCSLAENSLSCFVQTGGEVVKVDLLRHDYPILQPIQEDESIPFYSLEDICAMKLNAIANPGARKDFYDICAMLNIFSLTDMISFFERKYAPLGSFTVLKSLTYFDDAETEPDPVSLLDLTWHDVKAKLIMAVRSNF